MLPGVNAVAGLRKGWERFQACQREMGHLTKPEAHRMPIAESMLRGGMGAVLTDAQKRADPECRIAKGESAPPAACPRHPVKLQAVRHKGDITGNVPGLLLPQCGW